MGMTEILPAVFAIIIPAGGKRSPGCNADPVSKHPTWIDTEERDQFLERYYRLVTQFELIGGGVDRARAGVSDTIGLLRRRPEKHEPHELPSLPPAKLLNTASGQLEDGIAEITATLGGEHRSAAE
jgi:hypothetical protein